MKKPYENEGESQHTENKGEIKMARGPLETKVFKSLRDEGYTILENGWPDALAVSPMGDINFVEVKDKGDRVWPNQEKMLSTLHRAGLNVFVVGKIKRIPFKKSEKVPLNEISGVGTLDEILENHEKNIILRALIKANWKRNSAAKDLGISVESLRYRVVRLGIKKNG